MRVIAVWPSPRTAARSAPVSVGSPVSQKFRFANSGTRARKLNRADRPAAPSPRQLAEQRGGQRALHDEIGVPSTAVAYGSS